MASEFDRLMAEADAELFETFGEGCQAQYIAPGSAPIPVTIVLQRNVGASDGAGFVAVELAADIRVCEVRDPVLRSTLIVGKDRYLLDEHMGTDGLVNRYSLMPVR
ncbi:hypothetical protein [Pseudomonas sp. Marseille-QA0892]